MASSKVKSPLFSRKQSGGAFVVVDEKQITGDIFFVDSGSATGEDSVSAGNNPDRPLKTLDFAIGLVTANQGDVIVLMPGHTEAITDTNTVDLDEDGITIIGQGDGSDRPTFTVGSAVGATITVSGDNVTIKNILVSNIIDQCTSMMTITGDDFLAEDVETRDTGAVEAVLGWTITGDRWHLDRYTHAGEGSGDMAVAVIQATGTDRGILENFDIDAAGSTALFSSLSTANTLMRIRNGFMSQREAAVGVAISLLAADTGFVGPNIHIRLTDDDTDPYAAIDASSNVNFLGPITVAAGDDEAGLDIVPALSVEGDQNMVPTPYGPARVITEEMTPSTALVPIFTPTVGKSLVVGLYAEVTTELGTQFDILVQTTTTAADAVDLCALTVVDALKISSILGLTGDPADDLSANVARLKTPIVVDGGAAGCTIGSLNSEADSGTGVILWTLLYVPLERGALITAAA